MEVGLIDGWIIGFTASVLRAHPVADVFLGTKKSLKT